MTMVASGRTSKSNANNNTNANNDDNNKGIYMGWPLILEGPLSAQMQEKKWKTTTFLGSTASSLSGHQKE